MIQPIETVYNGYRFRSRLEARWAVFFDTLRVDYQYEPEGYDLNGTWYLPDFLISTIGETKRWVEIKGEEPVDDIVFMKLTDKTNIPTIVLIGDVWPDKCKIWHYFFTPCFCPDCKKKVHADSKILPVPDLNLNPGSQILAFMTAITGWPPTDGSKEFVLHAFTKARQARFEHGETP